jgi:hypothetical protein
MPLPGRRLSAPLLLVALALTGCGGGGPARVTGQTLRLRLDEYRIVPQDVTIPAGRIHVVARNAGRLPHNVEIASATRVDGNDHPLPVAHTHIARPGQVVGVWVTLRPGRYRMSCEVSNHDALGQWGTIRVTARRSARPSGESLPVPGAG